MSADFVLDSSALFAYFAEEEGATRVRSLFRMAARGHCSIAMHKINLLEVFYGAWNLEDRAKADELLRVVSSLSMAKRASN